ncbi:tetratricopeptide repeat protein [Youngiibacter fragilis]|uniref:Uncharacterized protein n=1 Tax=Youngiibacter fragilis 232.1 TaxID=994573 RepID=V7I740_9CLOT|nr:tetratricopeptide repeat protein [Youngiibacter fragilis]ETA80832.1 hypothetical protein T472_0209665 [Youngiibacter fragilis 232.1]
MGNVIAEALVRFNKDAVMEISRGNLKEALVIFEQSLAVEEKLKLGPELPKTLVNIASLHMLMGDFKSALEKAERAIEGFRKLGCRQEEEKAGLLAGRICLRLEDLNKAFGYFRNVSEKSKESEIKGEAYLEMSAILFIKKDYPKAQDHIAQAIAYFGHAGRKDLLKMAYHKRAEYFRSLKKEDLARQDDIRARGLESSMEI